MVTTKKEASPAITSQECFKLLKIQIIQLQLSGYQPMNELPVT